MTNPQSANYPYNSDVFTVVCERCEKTNEVNVVKQDGHNEPEEFSCAECGFELGKVRASVPPRTRIV